SFSAVLQEDYLVSGSIEDNITLGRGPVDRLWLQHCAQLAFVDDEIKNFPMGYNTLVGDAGVALSGGQKQRIFIARALYRHPKVLFLDEATSHLDIATEQALLANLRRLGITIVSVAHRQEALSFADRMIVMKRGRLVENFDKASNG